MLIQWLLAVLWSFAVLYMPASALAQSDPAVVGRWSTPVTWPIIAVHANLLPNKKVLVWGYSGRRRESPLKIRVWNPSTNTFTNAPNNSSYLFCAGQAFLPSGELLVTGGHDSPYNDGIGLPDTNIFNFANNTWRVGADMQGGRWYPTTVTLPTGEVLIVSGSIDDSTNNNLPQVWQTPTGGGYRDLTSARLTLPSYYPWLHVAPNGAVFLSGPEQHTRYLATSATGAWSTVAHTSVAGTKERGTSVMYYPGKVLIIGGKDPAIATAEVIDLNTLTPAWRTVAPMAFARRYHNATLLPDGTVFVSGGTTSANKLSMAALTPELWDPRTEGWTQMARMKVARVYHSTALLLADGRVLSSGGNSDLNGVDEFRVEFFSPPYLFKGARPVIGAAPVTTTYAQEFVVRTAQAAQIQRVTLVGLSSVTHGFNTGQRFNELPFRVLSANQLAVTAPVDPNVCPPGYYLLFILNGNGVPSVAKMLRVA